MVKLIYDPINLENLPLDDYLDNDPNNIVIIYNKKAYGVNKALFMFNNEMKRCIIANNALLKKKTYDNPETFYNIGYFIGKKAIVNQNTLNDVLKNHRIAELTSKTSGDTYINKELLELTTIGILKPPSKKSVGKVNFKHAYEDVYFDKLISDFLRQYSIRLYYYLNKCLLNLELYNKLYNNDDELLNTNSLLLFNNMHNNKLLNYELILLLSKDLKIKNKKNFKNIDFKNAIDEVITNIDKVFIEAAPRYEAPRYEKKYIHKVFYRGMAGKYINTNGGYLENIGDTALILNYTSVSSDIKTAHIFTASVPNPVIYNIYLEEGLPFINMVSTTKFKKEKEYLLPRNIIFELISKNGNLYTVIAKPFKKDQFAIKTGCIPLDFYDIKPATPLAQLSSTKSKKLSSSPPKVKSKADSAKSKDNVKPIKKRCPKGMVRNKITKECVSKAKAKPEAKLGRCPKGTLRNPKTLLCEAKPNFE
jgi:hypothetical protein